MIVLPLPLLGAWASPAIKQGLARYNMHIRLFVGADNGTKKVNKAIVEQTLLDNFYGYTLTESIGYWNGEAIKCKELSIIADITTDKTKIDILAVIEELKTKLNQESVGVQYLPEIQFI